MTRDERGLLYPARLPRFERVPAPDPVADLVRWFWIPEWDVAPGRVSRQHIIAFPACNLAVEPSLVGLAGPTTRRSFRDLSGSGWTVGALLRPAAVPALCSDPGSIRDRYEILDLPELHRLVSDAMTAQAVTPDRRRADAVRAFTDWLVELVPAPDDDGLLANAMADLLDQDVEVRTVAEAGRRLHVSARTLQRLARRYVGLSPVAMIRRRRLQEAAERLRAQPGTDIAALAVELGYTDHAHLTNDFRRMLDFTPSGYRKGTSSQNAGGANTG